MLRSGSLLWAGFAIFSVMAALAPATPTTQPDAQSPDPKLKPDDVVRIVVEALGKNDANDSGIRTTFRFASPGNKEMTGPVERFIPMVKGAGYAAMLNFSKAQYGKLLVRDDQAAQLVVLTAADGTQAGFLFQLSKQADGDQKDCWMTDGVIPVKPATQPADDDAKPV